MPSSLIQNSQRVFDEGQLAPVINLDLDKHFNKKVFLPLLMVNYLKDQKALTKIYIYIHIRQTDRQTDRLQDLFVGFCGVFFAKGVCCFSRIMGYFSGIERFRIQIIIRGTRWHFWIFRIILSFVIPDTAR